MKKIFVSYNTSTYSPCGDESCCSERNSYIEFHDENGKYLRELDSVPLFWEPSEVMEYVHKHYSDPNEELIFDVDESTFP